MATNGFLALSVPFLRSRMLVAAKLFKLIVHASHCLQSCKRSKSLCSLSSRHGRSSHHFQLSRKEAQCHRPPLAALQLRSLLAAATARTPAAVSLGLHLLPMGLAAPVSAAVLKASAAGEEDGEEAWVAMAARLT